MKKILAIMILIISIGITSFRVNAAEELPLSVSKVDNYYIRVKMKWTRKTTNEITYAHQYYVGDPSEVAFYRRSDGKLGGMSKTDHFAYFATVVGVNDVPTSLRRLSGVPKLTTGYEPYYIWDCMISNRNEDDTFYFETMECDIRVPVYKNKTIALNYLNGGVVTENDMELSPPYYPSYLDNKFIYCPTKELWDREGYTENMLSSRWPYCINNLDKTARYGCYIETVEGGYRVNYLSNKASLEMLSFPVNGAYAKDNDVGTVSNISFFAYKYKADGVMQFRSQSDLNYYIKTGIAKNAFVTGDYTIVDNKPVYDKTEVTGANKYRYNKALVLNSLAFETTFGKTINDNSVDVRWTYGSNVDGTYPARLNLSIGVKGYTFLGSEFNNIVQLNEGAVGDPICPRLDEKQYILTDYATRVKTGMAYKGADINLKLSTEYVLARVWRTVTVDGSTVYEYGPMIAYYSDGTTKDLGNMVDFDDIEGSKTDQDVFDSIYDDVNTIDKADKLGMTASELKGFVSDVVEGTNGNGFLAMLKDLTLGLIPSFIWAIVGFALVLLLIAKLVS